MIKIIRTPAEITPRLHSSIQRSKAKAEAFFSIPLAERIQRTPKFDDQVWKGFKKSLFALFNGKCGYCETKIVGDTGDVEMFRPKFGAIGLDKGKAPDHYWWLAYEWENLYLSCRNCNFSKSNKFPVNGPRGNCDMPVHLLQSVEEAILIDPCFDDPDEHLAFSDNGFVSPLTERGHITIDILNLNREHLVAARESDLRSFLETLSLAVDARRLTAEWSEQSVSPEYQYSAARRQCLHRFLQEHEKSGIKSRGNNERRKLKSFLETSKSYLSSSEQTNLDEKFLEEQVKSEEMPVASQAGTRFLYGKTQYITEVHIENFRNIGNLTIVFPLPVESKKPWIVLLGENGMGKSSILKAIALTLMADDQRELLDIDARDYLCRGSSAGYVEVKMEGYTKPFRLDFNASDHAFTSNNNVLHSLFFCYGGTRLLPNRRSVVMAETDDYSRIGNLFDPFCPLIDADKWLLHLNERQFGYSAKAIKSLLSQDDESTLIRVPPNQPIQIQLQTAYSDGDSLESLSDGYQSIIALVADISDIMLRHYDDISDSEGIVLIDEIDVHLHPRWKMEIVGLLRKVFPRVQFVITTHDPLCLLGTLPGEVHILRRNEESRSVEILQADVPPGTTADQVLTGFWFGLRSTLDSETLGLLDRHRELLLKEHDESNVKPAEIKQRKDLENQLRVRLGTFADTSIDRMAQSVASEVIQERNGKVDFEQRSSIRDEIRTKLNLLITEKGE